MIWAANLSLMASLLAPSNASAQSNKVRISDLSDMAYGTIVNLQADNRKSQSMCVSANSADGLYSVTASGTGPNGALELTNGFASLPYSVEWSTAPGQTVGSNLSANAPLLGQVTPEKQPDCKTRGLQTASLIVVLRATELSRAFQGNYSGTLSILIAAQ
jgi:hypothetical protein